MTNFSINDLSHLIGKFDCEELNKDWNIKTRSYGGFPSIKIEINKKDFYNRLEQLKGYDFKDFYLYSKAKYNYFEHPIRIDKIERFYKLSYEDNSKNLKFKIDSSSENYSLFLYLSKSLGPYYNQNLKLMIGNLALKKSCIQFQDL